MSGFLQEGRPPLILASAGLICSLIGIALAVHWFDRDGLRQSSGAPVTFADIPVMAAYLCLIALFFVLINLVVDLLYYEIGRAHV